VFMFGELVNCGRRVVDLPALEVSVPPRLNSDHGNEAARTSPEGHPAFVALAH